MSLYPTKRWFGGHPGYNQTVTVKEELHRLIEGLADEHARDLLDDLQDAADVNGRPPDSETSGGLRPEHKLDYSKARPNRFADKRGSR